MFLQLLMISSNKIVACWHPVCWSIILLASSVKKKNANDGWSAWGQLLFKNKNAKGFGRLLLSKNKTYNIYAYDTLKTFTLTIKDDAIVIEPIGVGSFLLKESIEYKNEVERCL